MDRKMKEIIVLLVILGLIYWQQSSAAWPVYVKVTENREWREF